MARFTNQGNQDQGTGKSSADLLKEQGLVEPGADGIGDPNTVMPKTTATSGTNIALPVLIMPDKNDFARAQQDELIDPSFRGKNTLIRTGQNTWTYYGPQLVTEEGRLSGGTYSSDGSDISSEFFGVRTAAERQTMISTAQKLGLFYGSKPSAAMMSGTGLDASDQRAVQGLLDFSVRNKLTWRAVAAKLSSGQMAPASGGGGTGNPNVFTGGSGGKGVVILSVPTARYSSTTTGSPTVTTSGTSNTGGGGGGSVFGSGGAGGSGIVILKYPDSFTISNPGGGLTISTPGAAGGFKISSITAGTGNIQLN